MHVLLQRAREYVGIGSAEIPGESRVRVFQFGLASEIGQSLRDKTRTVAALEAAVGLIDKSFGYLSIASYRGHAGGEEECEAVRKFFSKIKNARTEEAASSDNPKSPVLFTAKFVI